jgi:tRNA 2-thiouridine synthesizing protein C
MPLVYEDEDDDWAEKSSIVVLSRTDLAGVMADQDLLFNF